MMDENALQLLSSLSRELSTINASQVTVVIVQINNQQPVAYQTKRIEGSWEDLKQHSLPWVIEGAPDAVHVFDEGERFSDDGEEVYEGGEPVEEAISGPPARAQGLQESVRAALDRRKAPLTPPSTLVARYKRFEVVAFDGERLTVLPNYTRSLDGCLLDPVQLEQLEAPLRALAKAILSETDASAAPLFQRIFGCSIQEASKVSLSLFSRVFLGQGSPAEISEVLALVDWCQRGSLTRQQRESALVEYYQTYLGLSSEGFALNYFRVVHGASAERVLLRTPRVNTDELMIGDFVRWSGGRVAVIEKVFNLLSAATRIEVIELSDHGPAKTAYKLQPLHQAGTYLTSIQEATGEVQIFSPF
jgi:hypothetical protein